ncbi:hypothetical protein MKW94_016209 [Papaver nudicaule]|uniref:Alkyl transferase n=1 Tax=Papaver nudicaule TaxID=74823 RepID=A0AA41VZ38_PAPNU|nr:hypothetical protein [Papaver nudicaule]
MFSMINVLLFVVLVVVLIAAEKFRKSSTSLLFKSSSFSTIKRAEKSITKVVSSDAKFLLEDKLPAGLNRETIPKHVAVIMDGNRRWAKNKGLEPMLGHKAGVQSLVKLIPLCCNWGIKVLTVYAFSTENWIRPKVEVDFLMKLFEKILKEELESFMRQEVRISVIGDTTKLPGSLRKCIATVTETTKRNLSCHLIIAVNYSGRTDIVHACQSISNKVKDGLIKSEDIDERLINHELETKCTEFPYPDLLIRTSGELRLSNFLMWQLAYTELYFDESFWPDFGEKEFVQALHSFQRRQRRFGGQDQDTLVRQS